MFKKVLIANRGAIAVRVIRTLQKMGVGAVAVYAEADADSLHVELADTAIALGPGGASQTYLNQDKLLQIMAEHGIDAVHPGYGFLSENPDFVERCEAAGVAFIGPTPAQMRQFGLKHTARQLAADSGVPLLSGTPLLDTVDVALTAADEIGYPVMLKSTAGGGGIGMQICYDPGALTKAFDSVRRLSANNFSHDGVFLEKYIQRARHIEVQVFGDGKGGAVALGERDCSTQRRNQKVLEETPAPNLPDAIRSELHAVAKRLAAAVEYRNAGTVEFIYDDAASAFYFLEVNTRLQVEHGVTEEIFGVDLVEWMVRLAAGEPLDLVALEQNLAPRGHAIQARVYAECPHRDFQPSAGLLSAVSWPTESAPATRLRIDTWIRAGLEVPALFDPMLAKVIAWGEDRASALDALKAALAGATIQGIETNQAYLGSILGADWFAAGKADTRSLQRLQHTPCSVDVISPGTQTTIQDYPGRSGYWDVGVPPSGPYDMLAFRLGNRLLDNPEDAAGLEITLMGPTLKFNHACAVVVTGANIELTLDGQPFSVWQPQQVNAGQTLTIGKTTAAGARAYLLVRGGFDGNQYLGSRATFTLGQFGGFSGRALRTGDTLHLCAPDSQAQADGNAQSDKQAIMQRAISQLYPTLGTEWEFRVIYGPHGAPEFFTETDMDKFFEAAWEVHYHASRTGIRLIGPKPEWARSDGGEAGMHPSNIHDNAYAIGTLDFTGDMPVILGPDGPSLGGFVCPATIIHADLWQLGQLRAGDRVRFVRVDQATANDAQQAMNTAIAQLDQMDALNQGDASSAAAPALAQSTYPKVTRPDTVITRMGSKDSIEQFQIRPAGDHYLLVEYGPQMLDIELRFKVHTLMLWLRDAQQSSELGSSDLAQKLSAIHDLTPGIRSLQIHYDPLRLRQAELIEILVQAESELQHSEPASVPARIVHLPLSWNDSACQLAVEKYQQSVRKEAPWCPDNIEFIRRINGLDSVDEVRRIVFDARYLVMGLGDVYLGAPVATPIDPRHRLVTTKYNPARTWTAENSVGIGGSYLCVYGMEGPGGYQFIGRTLQMWNRYRQTREFSQPWLLRFFDQIQFYPVSEAELVDIRHQFPRGQYPLKIEETEFDLRRYQQFLDSEAESINAFTDKRKAAFDGELAHWIESGQFHFEARPDSASASDLLNASADADPALALTADEQMIDSHVAGSLWQWQVAVGDEVEAGATVCILESMKMEIEIQAPCAGEIVRLLKQPGQSVQSGAPLLVMRPLTAGAPQDDSKGN